MEFLKDALLVISSVMMFASAFATFGNATDHRTSGNFGWCIANVLLAGGQAFVASLFCGMVMQ